MYVKIWSLLITFVQRNVDYRVYKIKDKNRQLFVVDVLVGSFSNEHKVKVKAFVRMNYFEYVVWNINIQKKSIKIVIR